jgi:hypothetical protein
LISPNYLTLLFTNLDWWFKWVHEKRIVFQFASKDIDEFVERPYHTISLSSGSFGFSVTITGCCSPDIFKFEITKMLFFFRNPKEIGPSLLDALLPLF